MVLEFINPIVKVLTDGEALIWLRSKGGYQGSQASLATLWGWNVVRVSQRLNDWEHKGLIIRRDGTIIIQAPSIEEGSSRDEKIPRADLDADATAPILPPSPAIKRGFWRRFVMPTLTPKQRRDEYLREKERQRSRALTVVRDVAPTQVAPSAPSVVAPLSPTNVHRLAQPELVLGEYRIIPEIASAPTAWQSVGLCIAAIPKFLTGLAFASAGVFLVITSMRANAWAGYAVSIDADAGFILASLTVTSEGIAFLGPNVAEYYRAMGNYWTAFASWLVTLAASAVVFLTAASFVVTNVGDKTLQREAANIETSEVVAARKAIANAEKSRDAECNKVGPECRKRMTELTARQDELNVALINARKSATVQAEPLAADLGMSQSTLRMLRAYGLVAMCLIAGFVFSLGWGLMFRRR